MGGKLQKRNLGQGRLPLRMPETEFASSVRLKHFFMQLTELMDLRTVNKMVEESVRRTNEGHKYSTSKKEMEMVARKLARRF